MVASTSLVPHWAETLPRRVDKQQQTLRGPQARLFFLLGSSLLGWDLESLEWYLLLGPKGKIPRTPRPPEKKGRPTDFVGSGLSSSCTIGFLVYSSKFSRSVPQKPVRTVLRFHMTAHANLQTPSRPIHMFCTSLLTLLTRDSSALLAPRPFRLSPIPFSLKPAISPPYPLLLLLFSSLAPPSYFL